MKKRFSTGKRALALALSMVMCVGMLQITAFAEDGSDSTVESWEITMPSGEKIEVTGSKTDESWSGKSEDENVTVEGTFEVREESSESESLDKVEGSIETTPGETDDQDRILTESGSKVDTQETTITDTKITEEKETITETTTNQTDWVEGGVSVTIPGDFSTVTADKKDGYVPNLGGDLKTDASITWNTGDEKDLNGGGYTEGDISRENEKLKPDTEGATEGKNENGEKVWTKEESVEDGTKKTTITEKLDAAGNVIGYETVVETVTTQKGDTVETDGETLEDTDISAPDKNVETADPKDVSFNEDPQQVIELPSIPEDTFTHTDGTIGTVTAVTAILNEKGETIGYEVTTESEVLGEDGVTTTTTQTEKIYGKVTDTVTTGRTEQVTTTTETVNRKDTYEVAGKREDTVTTVTTVTKTEATTDTGNEGLKVTIEATEISGEQRDEIVKNSLSYQDGGWVNPDNVQQEDWDGIANEAVEFKCFVGASVDVSQTVSNGSNYDATMNVKVQLNESQLNSDLVLTITSNGQTTTYRLTGDAQKGEVKVEPDGFGNFTIAHSGVTSGTFDLNLTGKQKFEIYDGDEDQLWPDDTRKTETVFAHIDLKTSIKVAITEFKVSTTETSVTTTKEDTNVVSLSAEKVVETQTTEKTVLTTETTTKKSTDTWKNEWNTQYEYTDPEQPEPEQPEQPTTPVTPPTGGDDPTPPTGGDDPTPPTGGDDPTTPVVDVPDTDVPLVEEPVIDLPDEEVPLAEEPVVEILDEEVPLVEEVVIPGGGVPLADVPKTGDISPLWYLTTLLSACGLAILTLRKKDNG